MALHVLVTVPLPVQARVSAEEAARLGREFTAVGAIRDGNADGTIPQWMGKVFYQQFVAGTTKAFSEREALLRRYGDGREIPASIREAESITPELLEALRAFALAEYERMAPLKAQLGLPDIHPVATHKFDELKKKAPAEFQPLVQELERLMSLVGRESIDVQFEITRENLAEHADRLTAGQRAMFKRFPDFRMKVHPSVRSAYFPDAIAAATIANATSAELVGGRAVTGAKLGFPFPIPKSGEEVIWNHKMKYRGASLHRVINDALVEPDGTYHIAKTVQDIGFFYANPGDHVPEKRRGRIFSILMETLDPPDISGQRVLAHENIEEGAQRDVFLFTPGIGIRAVPDAGYDTPVPMSYGEVYADQMDMYNGATDRYDWKLVGRREVYIPYNCFELNSPMLQYKDLLTPHAIARDYARYELHRVWVVDATVKEGVNHQLKRRTFYVDEDSWSIAAVDAYDNTDRLWRYQEAYLIPVLFIGTVSGIPEAYYDLQSGRYFASGLTNEETIPDWTVRFADGHFTQRNLRDPKLFAKERADFAW